LTDCLNHSSETSPLFFGVSSSLRWWY